MEDRIHEADVAPAEESLRASRFKTALAQSAVVHVIALACQFGLALIPFGDVAFLVVLVVGPLALWLVLRVPADRPGLLSRSLGALVIVNVFGVVIGREMTLANLIPIGVVICALDIVSFTRKGAWTANARAMARPDLKARMIVYGRARDGRLLPLKGLGDFVFYAIIIGYAVAHLGAPTGLMVTGAIYLGCAVLWAVVAGRYRRPGYNGIAGTALPFLLAMAVIVPATILAG